jgi:hypothetical protein
MPRRAGPGLSPQIGDPPAPEIIQQVTTHLSVAGPVVVVIWLLVAWAAHARLGTAEAKSGR